MRRCATLVLLICGSLAAATAAAEAPASLTVTAPPVVGISGGGGTSFSLVVTNAGAGGVTATVGIVGPAGELPEGIEIVPPTRDVKMGGGGSQSVAFRILSHGSVEKTTELHAIVQWKMDGAPAEHRAPFTLVVSAEDQAVGGGAATRTLGLAMAMGAGAGGAAGGALLWLRRVDWSWLRGATAFALYSRIRRSDVLDHAKRAELLRLIESTPGIRFSELQQATGLPNGTLYHHLRKLEEAELITTMRRGRSRRYAMRGSSLAEDRLLAAGEAELLAAIPPEGVTVRELTERLQITRQGVAYRIRSLQEKGLVSRRLVGTKWRWFVREAS